MTLEEKLTPVVRTFIAEITSVIVQSTKDDFLDALNEEFGWDGPDPLKAAREKLAKMRTEKKKLLDAHQPQPKKIRNGIGLPEQTFSPAQKDRIVKRIAAERGISELSVQKSWHRISKKL